MRRWNRQLIVVLAVLLGLSGTAMADWQQSSNYGMNESELGGNGCSNEIAGCGTSAGYSLNPNIGTGGSTLGEFATGNSSSASYQTGSGFNTTEEPTLGLIVNTTSVDLGALTTSAKSTAVATFSVLNYTSYGYVVQVVGTVPTNSGHALTPLATDTASSAGVEQFGINLVLNSTSGVGADPVQVPSSGFSYGVAGDGATGTYGTNRPYTVPEKWRYVAGETVASAPKSSGETDYTMTFMANISNVTPGGKYQGNLSVVATGTF
jgi:hypothetical protein